MQNLVGDYVPSEAEIEKLVKEVEAIQTKLEKYCVSLTADDRQKAIKIRTGGRTIVSLIGTLLEKHGVILPDVSREAMNADMELAERLAPLAAALGAVNQLVDDTILEAHSEAWWAATAGYSTLQRMASQTAGLGAALAPAVEFFRLGKRKPKVVSK